MREDSSVGAESVAWFLIVIAIFGLIVGAIARLLVPGATRLGLIQTMGAGIAGALIGGFVGRLLLGPKLTQGWTWVLSILGATLVVALVSRRDRTYVGRPPRRRLMSERADDRVVADDGRYRSRHSRWSKRGLLPGRAHDDQVVDAADRPDRSRQGRCSRRRTVPGRGYDDQVEVDEIGRPYRPVTHRRRRLF